MAGNIIGLIGSCLAFLGLCYAWHRVHVLEKKLEKYEGEDDNG